MRRRKGGRSSSVPLLVTASKLAGKAIVDFGMIEDGDKDAILTIEFSDDERLKRADLNINDRLREIDTEDKSYTKKLNDGTDPDLLEEGNNFIEITPRTRLDIVEIRVELRNR